MIVNALTVDVEDYFQVHAFSNTIRPQDWDSFESRVERNTYRLLDLLDSCEGPRTKDGRSGEKPLATFFVLGWIAERYPALVKNIHSRGHEIACHGYSHQSIFEQSRDEFKEDVRRAKGILEDLTGVEVFGFRAPTYSITVNTLWALEILFELGFRYDSSIFPIKHDFYGLPEAPRFPFCIDFPESDILRQLKEPKFLHKTHNTAELEAANQISETPAHCASDLPREVINRSHLRNTRNCLVEFPLSTIAVFGLNLPCAGGGYFRLLPYRFTRWGLKKLNQCNSKPAIFYIHPWELDPNLPVINSASHLSKFRTYINLRKTESRFKRLLAEFKFTTLASMLTTYCPH